MQLSKHGWRPWHSYIVHVSVCTGHHLPFTKHAQGLSQSAHAIYHLHADEDKTQRNGLGVRARFIPRSGLGRTPRSGVISTAPSHYYHSRTWPGEGFPKFHMSVVWIRKTPLLSSLQVGRHHMPIFGVVEAGTRCWKRQVRAGTAPRSVSNVLLIKSPKKAPCGCREDGKMLGWSLASRIRAKTCGPGEAGGCKCFRKAVGEKWSACAFC